MSFMGRGLVYGGPRPPLVQAPFTAQMIPPGSMLDPSQARLLANPAGLATQQQTMNQLAGQTALQQPPPMQPSHLSLFAGTSQPSSIMTSVHNGSLLSGTPMMKKRKADEKSEHDGSLTPGLGDGDAINLWRFDEHLKKLYVARSLLFLDRQSYINIRRQFEAL